MELKAIVECMARVTETSEHIDINQMTVLQSVAVDRHEVLSTLVSNIGHEHKNWLNLCDNCHNAQLRQTTSSS
jgi:transcriptional regulator of heat shock response